MYIVDRIFFLHLKMEAIDTFIAEVQSYNISRKKEEIIVEALNANLSVLQILVI